jgi:drug/metabolite transporter (DMT)-like permease
LFKPYYIKLFMAAFLWGGALVAGRIVAVNLPPFTTTFLRFTAVSLFLLPILYIKEKKLPVPTLKTALILIILSISGILLFNFFLFSSLRTVTASRSSVIISFTPAAVAVISSLFIHEKITPLMIAGLFLALLGAVITITNGDIFVFLDEGLHRGDLYLLGCVISWALYSIIAKYAMTTLSPLNVLTYVSCIGVVLLIPFALMEGALFTLSEQPIETWLSLLYLSIGATGFAYLWYYEGIKAIGSSRSAIFLNVEPLAAITLGMLILEEQLTISISIGAVLVISGLFLTNYKNKQKIISH